MVRKPSGLLWVVLVLGLGLGFMGLRWREQNIEIRRHDAAMASCAATGRSAYACEVYYLNAGGGPRR